MWDVFSSFLFGSVIDLIHYVYQMPLIKELKKRSLMGFEVNKTIDYYMSKLEISPIDDEYYIKYKYKMKDYMLVCDKDQINVAIDFIKSRGNIEHCDTIAYAADKNTDKSPVEYIDITEKVKMFAGPTQDFYINTDFHVKKKFITSNELYILTKSFNRYVYAVDDEYIRYIR